MKARVLVALAALSSSLVAGCSESRHEAAGEVSATSGRRDTVVGAAAPICAPAAQAYVASQATAWWQQSVDPTGRRDTPYAYATRDASPPILAMIAALKQQGVVLKPEASAHHWELRGDHARLSVEGLLTGEPGYMATFELAAKDGRLTIESLELLRGATRYACEGERLVPRRP